MGLKDRIAIEVRWEDRKKRELIANGSGERASKWSIERSEGGGKAASEGNSERNWVDRQQVNK